MIKLTVIPRRERPSFQKQAIRVLVTQAQVNFEDGAAYMIARQIDEEDLVQASFAYQLRRK